MLRNRLGQIRSWIDQQSRGVRAAIFIGALIGIIIANQAAGAIGDVGQYEEPAVYIALALPTIVLFVASAYVGYAVIRSAISNWRKSDSPDSTS